MTEDNKDEFLDFTNVSDLVHQDLQELVRKYAENDLPVYDVVNAYLEHSIDLAFLMNNSAENAMKMIEEHILKSSYSEDKNIH